MTSVLKKAVLGLTAASALAVTATPADAQYRTRYYGHHHGDDAAWAIGAGILGLGIGAAIASGNHGYYGNGYYSNGYYGDPYYGSYGGSYAPYGYGYGYNSYGYGAPGYYGGYGRHCATRRQWDPYYGRWVRVRYC